VEISKNVSKTIHCNCLAVKWCKELFIHTLVVLQAVPVSCKS